MDSFGLQFLLIKPVQRVLKYPLLLQQLVKNTSDKHPDYADVHAANASMSKVAQDINEIKRRKDLGMAVLFLVVITRCVTLVTVLHTCSPFLANLHFLLTLQWSSTRHPRRRGVAQCPSILCRRR